MLLGRTVKYPNSPNEAELDCVPNQNCDVLFCVRLTAPEFTSICPVTGQPDFGTIIIDYIPSINLIESKALKLYLGSFRNHGIFHEDVVVTIGKAWLSVLNPQWMRVAGLFKARGGITIDTVWQSKAPPLTGVYIPKLPLSDQS